VLVELPARQLATSEAGWRAVRALSQALARDPRVARVRSLPIDVNIEHPSPTLLSVLPSDVRSFYMSRDERLAMIELIPRENASEGNLMRFVRELRHPEVAAASGLPGVRISVSGLPALNADYQDAIGRSVTRVLWLVVGGTFVALLVGFRSLLVPIKAIALNLLSVAAAMGAAVLVFQDGIGARLIGLSAPVDGLFPAVPMLVFCIVFGLSMDYEVFLVARISEGIDSGMSERDALVEGLARTGGIITSAALVMIVVFSGFALGDFLIIKILGFTLATAVLLDATVVRVAVGPALLRLAGRWNWWPGRR
jgi:RND superfamily putative drug exporter